MSVPSSKERRSTYLGSMVRAAVTEVATKRTRRMTQRVNLKEDILSVNFNIIIRLADSCVNITESFAVKMQTFQQFLQ
jgi:hypothetical protein